VKVLRSLPLLRSTDRLTPWLYTIARRMVVNRYRREASDAVVSPRESIEATAEDEHEAIEQFESAELVHFAVKEHLV